MIVSEKAAKTTTPKFQTLIAEAAAEIQAANVSITRTCRSRPHKQTSITVTFDLPTKKEAPKNGC